MHRAAMGSSGQIIRLLAKKGGDPNAKNRQGWTPLHRVVHPEVAEVLIQCGADVGAKDKQGRTPLHLVAGGKHGDAMVSGAGSAASSAVAKENLLRRKRLVVLLLKHGAQANARDDNGATPLHGAAEEGRADVVRALVSAGADPHLKDQFGATPAKYASISGHKELAHYLDNLPVRRRGEPTIEGQVKSGR